jgi:hypothetical protein
VKPRVDGGGALTARWRSGEHEKIEIEGDETNQGVFRVAGIEAELTGATDTAGTRRRPWNRPETTVDGGGAPRVRARCEAGAGVLRVRE